MKCAKELKIGDKVFFYRNNGTFLYYRTIKTLGINCPNVLFLHFGFDKDGNTMNSYPKFSDTFSKVTSYRGVETHNDEIAFFSKEAVSKYFKNVNGVISK